MNIYIKENENKLTKILKKTENKENKYINGKKEILSIYEIDYSNLILLKFNPFNTRIFDSIKSNKIFNKMSENELRKSEEVQEFIFNILKKPKEKKADNNRLKKSIREDGLREYLICLNDGLLLSGNNRLSILKQLKEKNEKNKIINIAIYEGELNENQILENELYLQNDQKVDYNQMSKVIRIGDLVNKNYFNNKIAEMMAMSEGEVTKNKKINNLYEEFLIYSNFSEKYDFYRYFNNLYSMLSSLENMLSKKTLSK